MKLTPFKKKIVYVLSIILMLVLIIAPLKKLSMIFANDDTAKRMDSLYAQPKGSVDVICAGSSRIYCNVAPSVMWSEYGISAYNLATSAQPLNLTYYALKEAFKYQSPKVTVVEVSTVIPADEPNDQLETMGLQGAMKYSTNQMGALLDHFDKEHFMEYLFRFPCFHYNYADLDKESFENIKYFQFPKTQRAGFKGYVNDAFFYSPVSFPQGVSYDDVNAVERYASLEKIYNLCKEKGTELVLILTPTSQYSDIDAVNKFASDFNVPYLNCMNHIDEIGLTGEGDMIDEVHCSYYGAAKVSRFLGQYIIDNYDVENHLGDSYYESWDEYANYMALTENNYYLARETGLGNYFNYIPNPNYIIITSLKGNYDVRDVGQRSVLAKLGCNDVAYEAGGAWILDGSQLKFYYSALEEKCEWSEDLYGSSFRITNCPNGEIESDVKIYIDGTELIIYDEENNPVNDGLEFIVYDKLSQRIVDAVIFDSVHDYRIVRYKAD